MLTYELVGFNILFFDDMEAVVFACGVQVLDFLPIFTPIDMEVILLFSEGVMGVKWAFGIGVHPGSFYTNFII